MLKTFPKEPISRAGRVIYLSEMRVAFDSQRESKTFDASINPRSFNELRNDLWEELKQELIRNTNGSFWDSRDRDEKLEFLFDPRDGTYIIWPFAEGTPSWIYKQHVSEHHEIEAYGCISCIIMKQKDAAVALARDFPGQSNVEMMANIPLADWDRMVVPRSHRYIEEARGFSIVEANSLESLISFELRIVDLTINERFLASPKFADGFYHFRNLFRNVPFTYEIQGGRKYVRGDTWEDFERVIGKSLKVVEPEPVKEPKIYSNPRVVYKKPELKLESPASVEPRKKRKYTKTAIGRAKTIT